MQSILAGLLIALLASSGGVLGVPSPDCTSPAIQEMPRMRNMCAALYALQAYLDDASNYPPVSREGSQTLENMAKRQDEIHRFLRFGRRR